MDRPFTVDIVVRHDVLDAQIAGFRTIATRFWNPPGNRVRLFAEKGAVTFRNIRIRPLVGTYAPYPQLPRSELRVNKRACPPFSPFSSPGRKRILTKAGLSKNQT